MTSTRSARRGFLAVAALLGSTATLAQAQGADNLVLHVRSVQDLEQIDAGRLARLGQGVCDVAGYWEPGDGGGGWFDWDATATAAADEFMVFRPKGITPASQGRWRRRLPPDGYVTLEMAGARGDGVTDCWPAADKVIGQLTSVGGGTIRLLPLGQYVLSRDLDLSWRTPSGAIVLEGTGASMPHERSTNPITFHGSRLIIPPTCQIKLGDCCVLRRVVVWRQGLPEKPTSLEDVRRNVAEWFREDGVHTRLSVGICAPFVSITIQEVTVVGFHTGIQLGGGDNRIDHCNIDAAGCGVECTNIAGDCELNTVKVCGAWSQGVDGSDALGDHSYRPGTAFFVHDRADGLLMTNCQSEHWVYGLVLRDVWMVTVFAFGAETTLNGGEPSYGIWTQNEVRHVEIINPKIASDSTCIRFSHSVRTSAVGLYGGMLEMDGPSGYCIQIDGGTSGQIFGTMTSNGRSPALKIAAGIIEWKIFALQLWTSCFLPWAEIDPASLPNVYLVGTRSLDGAAQHYLQSHINERMMISYDSAVTTSDGSPRAPLSVNSLAAGSEVSPAIALLRHGVEVAAFWTTPSGVSLAADRLAFFDAPPVGKPTVTGSVRNGEALKSMISALASLGLIVDRSTD